LFSFTAQSMLGEELGEAEICAVGTMVQEEDSIVLVMSCFVYWLADIGNEYSYVVFASLRFLSL